MKALAEGVALADVEFYKINYVRAATKLSAAGNSLGKTLNSTDASGWEKIMAIWNALSTSVDGILNIIDAVKGWTKASDDLKKGKEAEQAIVTGANAKEIVSNTTAAVVSTTTAETEASDNTKTVARQHGRSGLGGREEQRKDTCCRHRTRSSRVCRNTCAHEPSFQNLPKVASSEAAAHRRQHARACQQREMIRTAQQQRRPFNAITAAPLGLRRRYPYKQQGTWQRYVSAIDNYVWKSKNKKVEQMSHNGLIYKI